MTFIATAQAHLQKCYACGQPWPDDDGHRLRAGAWLDPLPRSISPTNLDALLVHNGHNGSEFVALELKGPTEPAMNGQLWALRELAGLSPRLHVYAAKGTLSSVSFGQILPNRRTIYLSETDSETIRHDLEHWLLGNGLHGVLEETP